MLFVLIGIYCISWNILKEVGPLYCHMIYIFMFNNYIKIAHLENTFHFSFARSGIYIRSWGWEDFSGRSSPLELFTNMESIIWSQNELIHWTANMLYWPLLLYKLIMPFTESFHLTVMVIYMVIGGDFVSAAWLYVSSSTRGLFYINCLMLMTLLQQL